MTTGTRPTGDFCWINMLTPDPADAREFFRELLGWGYAAMPGIGHRIQVAGRDIGGLFDLNGPNTPPGTPPTLGVMVKVESADDTCRRIDSLGGRTKPPFDIMGAGRMAVCFDPNGAEFDAWQPYAMRGTDVDSRLHGAPSWFETLTTDVAKASAFYSALFGWTPDVAPIPGAGGTYTTFQLGDTPIAGMLAITPEMAGTVPHWGTYFTVTDIEEVVRKANSLGAVLSRDVREAPGVGRFCGFTSPQGVPFCVIQYTG